MVYYILNFKQYLTFYLKQEDINNGNSTNRHSKVTTTYICIYMVIADDYSLIGDNGCNCLRTLYSCLLMTSTIGVVVLQAK